MLKRHNIYIKTYNKPKTVMIRPSPHVDNIINIINIINTIKKSYDEKDYDEKDYDEKDFSNISTMSIVLSFIGKIPNYIDECIRQIRFFFDGDVYLISNDINAKQYSRYNVKLIDYEEVRDKLFEHISNIFKNKFTIVNGLKGREQLFLRSLERFFLLHNLMKNKNLKNCLFMEIDNLIYDDPRKWIENFSKKDIAYMFDNNGRCSSGIMYIKTSKSITDFLKSILIYISTDKGFINEMTCLFNYFIKNMNNVQILPTYYTSKLNYNKQMYLEYENYNSIFDAAAIGCYLTGIDPFHTGGKIILYKKWEHSKLDCTHEKFQWITDEYHRRRPHIWNNEKGEWILINNLHVHSKNLIAGLSS